MFDLEEILIKTFISQLDFNNEFELQNLSREFNYLSGRTDILIETKKGNLIALEAKLKKWKTAIHQAYKNTSFADYSYVILPYTLKDTVKNSEFEFIKRGIGLILVNKDDFNIEINAKKLKPIMPWLNKKALNILRENNNG